MRDPYFDNVKFALITLVVLGHFINIFIGTGNYDVLYPFKVWLWIFHMPAFIFISGLFAKSLYKRGEGLKVDSIAFYLVVYVLFYCSLYLAQSTYSHPKFNPFSTYGVPWYLLALAILGASTPIAAHAKKSIVLPASIVLAFTSGFFSEFGDFLALARIANFAPFYFAGYYLDRKKFGDWRSTLTARKWPVVLAVVVLAATYLLVCLLPSEVVRIIHRLSLAHYSYEECGKAIPIIGIALMRFAWFPVAAAMSLALFLVIPRRRFFISTLGERTLQVYILHAFAYLLLNGFGFPDWYAAQSIPLSALWIIVGACLITVLLALPRFPERGLAALRRCVKISNARRDCP